MKKDYVYLITEGWGGWNGEIVIGLGEESVFEGYYRFDAPKKMKGEFSHIVIYEKNVIELGPL